MNTFQNGSSALQSDLKAVNSSISSFASSTCFASHSASLPIATVCSLNNNDPNPVGWRNGNKRKADTLQVVFLTKKIFY